MYSFIKYCFGIIFFCFIYQISFSENKEIIDVKKYPVFGIDLSKHSGKVNWDTLLSQKIHFIYIKCTEGGDYVDPNFKAYFDAAQKNKVPVGCYHFFRFEKKGKLQADNFLKNLPKNYSKQLPIVIDIENYNPKKEGVLPRDEILKEIKIMFKIVKKKTKQVPIIYTNKKTYYELLDSNFTSYKYWFSAMPSVPNFIAKNKWHFWQYKLNYKIKGVEGKVDLNTFNGDIKKWKKYLSSRGIKYIS